MKAIVDGAVVANAQASDVICLGPTVRHAERWKFGGSRYPPVNLLPFPYGLARGRGAG